MSLLQTTISRGPQIVVSAQAGSRDFTTAIQGVLERIPPNNSRLTYVWEQYLIHYVSEGGVVYLVMADESIGRRMPFAFLADIQRKFSTGFTSSEIDSAEPYGLQDDFEPELKALMEQYVKAPPPDALRQAQTDLGNVKDIMVNNIDAILSRGERIELLVDKTDNLSTQAWQFKRGAKNVRRKMWWKNTRIVALSGFVVVFLFYLLVAEFCGLSLSHCSSRPEPKPDTP